MCIRDRSGRSRRSIDRRRARTAGSSTCVSTGTTTGKPIGESRDLCSTRCPSVVTVALAAGAPVRDSPSVLPRGVGTTGWCNSTRCRIDSTELLPNAVPTTERLLHGVSAAGGGGSRIAGRSLHFICVRVFPNWVGRVNSVRSGAKCSPRSACRVPWRGWTRRSVSHDHLIPKRRQTVGAPPGRGPHTLCCCH